MNEIETWRAIKGLEGRYEISSSKRVRTLLDNGKGWGVKRIIKHRSILKYGVKSYQIKVKGVPVYFREDDMYRGAFPDALDSRFIEKSNLKRTLLEEDIKTVHTHMHNVIKIVESGTFSIRKNGELTGYVLLLQKWINDLNRNA
jgi:hypothetical protein